jgi:hypothetical protein
MVNLPACRIQLGGTCGLYRFRQAEFFARSIDFPTGGAPNAPNTQSGFHQQRGPIVNGLAEKQCFEIEPAGLPRRRNNAGLGRSPRPVNSLPRRATAGLCFRGAYQC